MKVIELNVELIPTKKPYIRYEWFGLKGQAKRIRRYYVLEQGC